MLDLQLTTFAFWCVLYTVQAIEVGYVFNEIDVVFHHITYPVKIKPPTPGRERIGDSRYQKWYTKRHQKQGKTNSVAPKKVVLGLFLGSSESYRKDPLMKMKCGVRD